MLVFDNVSFSYNEHSNLIHNLNLKVKDGEFLAITGRNGCGKTTLLKLANGLLKPQSGSILFNGVELFDRKQICKNIGLVFQFPEHQLFEETVLDDVCFGPLNLDQKIEDAQNQARKALRLVGLGENFEKRSPFDLSEGEKRLVAVAGVIAMDSKIIALDEPTSGLDSVSAERLLNTIKALNSEGKTIIMVSHTNKIIEQYCSSVFTMGD